MKSDVNRPVPNAPDMSGHAYPTHFPLSLAKRSGETAVSFAGRLALKNGYSCLQEMCADQSIQLRSLCNGQAQEIRRIAELAGSEFDKLHFDTPTLTKPGWFDLGREQIKFTSFARMGGQICPTCISEDRAMVPQIFGHQKGVWQISALRSCHEHSVLLEQNDVKGSSKWVHDFALHVRDWSPSEVTQIPPDSMTLEHYLADRIQHGRRSEWLDRFEFHVVSQFCEALGTLLKFGPDARPHQLAPEEIVKAGAAGFDIARGGADAILLKLDDIRQQSPKSSRPDYAALFGPVFANLRERRNDPDFSFLRKVLRDYILDIYYVPEGTSLLGEVCGAPRALTRSKALLNSPDARNPGR
ncbi:MAG: TniQ family protein [Maritimibacter sp.]